MVDISGLTLRQIAQKPFFSKPPAIPFGTIGSMYHDYPMPNKYRGGRGIPKIVKVPENMVRKNKPVPRGKPRNRRAINLDDPASGADTIIDLGGARYAYDLVGEILERIGKEVSDE